MTIKKWNKDEISLLKDLYPYHRSKHIQENYFPSRTINQIGSKARYLGAKKYYLLNKKKSFKSFKGLGILLKDTPESYFWIGFLLSGGGGFYGTNSFRLNMKKNDLYSQYVDFLKYINCFNEKIFAETKTFSKNCNIVKDIKNKFDFADKKVSNPPDFSLIKDPELMLSLIIGFIDGRAQFGVPDDHENFYWMKLRTNSAWENSIKYFYEFLSFYANSQNQRSNFNKIIKKNQRLYLVISDIKILNLLRSKINDLPINKKKWEFLQKDFHYTQNTLFARNIFDAVFKLGIENINYNFIINNFYVSPKSIDRLNEIFVLNQISINQGWTPREDQIIIDNYSHKTKNEILKNLPGKTYFSFGERLKHLKIKKFNRKFPENKPWSLQEDQTIIDNYGKISYQQIANSLTRRTSNSIVARVTHLKSTGELSKSLYETRSRHKKWSSEEEKIIIDNYPNMTRAKILYLLKDRKISSLEGKIIQLQKKNKLMYKR